MNHESIRTALFFLVVPVAVTMAGGHARAEDAPTSPGSEIETLAGICYARPITRVYVPMVGGEFQVSVGHGKVAYVQFPETIKLTQGIFEHRGFRIDQHGNTLTISPSPSVAIGTVANIVLELGKVRVSMDMRVIESGQPASLVEVVPLPDDDFERQKAEAEAKLEATRAERDARTMRSYRRALARTLLGLREVRPRFASLELPPATHYAPEGEARGALIRVFESNGYRYLEVMLENRTERNIEMQTAYISEGASQAVPVDVVLQEPDKSIAELPFVARTQDKVRAMVVVPESIAAGLSGLRVHFQGPPGLPTIVATEVIELWPRMPEHIQRRRRWAKQISVSARVLGGGYWMGIGDDPTVVFNGNEGTGLTGLGVRVSKGMHRNLVFEGEFVGGRSGAASFSDVSWDGMTGDVTRQAGFGRAQAMGVVRFGYKYLTSVRMGVGLQMTSFTSTMTTGGAAIDGPGDGLEIDGLWSVGAGFDARLGEHWLAGIGTDFSRTWATGSSSLVLGLHLGYRWSLAGEDGSLNY